MRLAHSSKIIHEKSLCDLVVYLSREKLLCNFFYGISFCLLRLKTKTLFSLMFWWFNVEVTPVLIPNTEVKLYSADDTRKGKVGSRQNIVLNFFY